MYITRPKRQAANGKVYETILLREAYREHGKVKNRTLANFTHCQPEEIAAIEFALKHKEHLGDLVTGPEALHLQEGQSIGAVYTLYRVAQRLGMEKALGTDRQGQLALWQVLARVLEQGSRLSAVRLAQVHAATDVLAMTQGFQEDDLYANLTWLAQHQPSVEDRLFRIRRKGKKAELFLYDVTSSYLEGEQNELAEYGYNRDKKRGKKQIVIGLLCDEQGDPVSTEVFSGETQDVKTFHSQIQKVAQRFGCERVTLVGDRGMIKQAQIKELEQEKLQYITAITKPQIQKLLKKGVLQMALFDEELCEVEFEGMRYILRRNPVRVQELEENRQSKKQKIEEELQQQNQYLQEHPKARVEVARRKLQQRIRQLRLDSWLQLQADERTFRLQVDEEALARQSQLDGCYVLRTDVPTSQADRTTIHERYKDLTWVENAFRTCKTGLLEVRPVYVRKEENTRGHVFVVMLAYLIVRRLQQAWEPLNVTVEEGLHQLMTLCTLHVEIQGEVHCQQIPKPREQSQHLLQALGIELPPILPHRNLEVVTRKTLAKES